jgi:RND superfamily putative drug exporter
MTGRLGRFCFRHRWLVLVVWLLIIAGGVLAYGPLQDALADSNSVKNAESSQAFDVLSTSDSSGTVVGLVDRVDPNDKVVHDAVNHAADDLFNLPGVKRVDTPWSPGSRGLVAKDTSGLLVQTVLEELSVQQRNDALDTIKQRLAKLDDELAAAGRPDARVRVGGDVMLNIQRRQAMQADLSRAEVISLPLTLVALVFVFGGLVAAGLPVLAAIFSVAAVFPVLYFFSTITDVDSNGLTVATLLGLGLSVDYGLLLVGRYREEVGAGFEPEVALGRAWATAGRTILFSALTVAAALAGLLVFRIHQISALGAAGVSTALVAMLVSLTLTAALLGLTRRWIKPSKKQLRRRAHFGDAAELGFFAKLSRFVQRRPLTVALATVLVLVAAGLPLVSATIKLPGMEGVPRSIEAAQVYDELNAHYGQQFTATVTVVARTDTSRLDTYAAKWKSDPAVADIQAARPAGPGVSLVRLALKGDSQDDAAQALVKRLRADRPAGTQSWVTGDAAVLLDLDTLIVDDLPWAVAVTVLAMIILLFAFTGSLVVPVKAIIANVVSLGATFGVMVAVFEHGFGSGVLDTMTVGGLDPFVLVIVLGFAFGLSMDYEVFLLGRIKEYVDRGWDTDTAVRRGLQHTGRIITSAALLMIIVFSCFAAARTGAIEQIGLGLTTAVLIDATVVRCLLVPATMTLLGKWNWWAPQPLKRLHERFGLKEHVLPEADPVPEPVPSNAGS